MNLDIPITNRFSATDSAAKRIAFLMSQEDKPCFLRISVIGGGCSGFQYKFDFDHEIADDDLKIEANEAIIIIDETSLELIAGSQLDYVETLGAAAFEIKNPNAAAKCGCGNSFAL